VVSVQPVNKVDNAKKKMPKVLKVHAADKVQVVKLAHKVQLAHQVHKATKVHEV
jgi:hypothetical protein